MNMDEPKGYDYLVGNTPQFKFLTPRARNEVFRNTYNMASHTRPCILSISNSSHILQGPYHVNDDDTTIMRMKQILKNLWRIQHYSPSNVCWMVPESKENNDDIWYVCEAHDSKYKPLHKYLEHIHNFL